MGDRDEQLDASGAQPHDEPYELLPPPDFDVFFTSSFARVVAAVSPLVGGFDEAEDVAQEAFSAAAARWDQVGRYEDPEGWVRRVAYNRAISVLRSAARRARHLAHQQMPVLHTADELEAMVLVEALRRLPMKYRAVLTLHYLVDLTVQQVADELGLPFLTVRSHLARGRDRLRRLLADDELPNERRLPGE